MDDTLLMKANMDSKTPHSSHRLFLAIFLAALATLGGLWFGISKTLEGVRIDPTTLFTAPLPESVQPLYGVDTGSGIVAEFFDAATRIKVSLAKAPLDAAAPAAAKDVFDAALAYQTGGAVSPTVAPLIVKFVAAQLDTRRAYEVTRHELSLGAGTVPVLTFTANRGSHYALCLLTDGAEQTVLLALMKNEPVKIESLTGLLSQLKRRTAASEPL